MVCSSLEADEVLPSPYSNQSRKKDDHLPRPKVPPPSPHRCLSNHVLLQSYTSCWPNRWRGTWVRMGEHQPCCCADQTDGSHFTSRDNWWSFWGLESPQGPWIWWVRPLGFLNTSWLVVPGASLLRKLKNVYLGVHWLWRTFMSLPNHYPPHQWLSGQLPLKSGRRMTQKSTLLFQPWKVSTICFWTYSECLLTLPSCYSAHCSASSRWTGCWAFTWWWFCTRTWNHSTLYSYHNRIRIRGTTVHFYLLNMF